MRITTHDCIQKCFGACTLAVARACPGSALVHACLHGHGRCSWQVAPHTTLDYALHNALVAWRTCACVSRRKCLLNAQPSNSECQSLELDEFSLDVVLSLLRSVELILPSSSPADCDALPLLRPPRPRPRPRPPRPCWPDMPVPALATLPGLMPTPMSMSLSVLMIAGIWSALICRASREMTHARARANRQHDGSRSSRD